MTSRISQRSKKQEKFRRHIAALSSKDSSESAGQQDSSSNNHQTNDGKHGSNIKTDNSNNAAAAAAAAATSFRKPRSSFGALVSNRSLPSNLSQESADSKTVPKSKSLVSKRSLTSNPSQESVDSKSSEAKTKPMGLQGRMVGHRQRTGRSLTRASSVDKQPASENSKTKATTKATTKASPYPTKVGSASVSSENSSQEPGRIQTKSRPGRSLTRARTPSAEPKVTPRALSTEKAPPASTRSGSFKPPMRRLVPSERTTPKPKQPAPKPIETKPAPSPVSSSVLKSARFRARSTSRQRNLQARRSLSQDRSSPKAATNLSTPVRSGRSPFSRMMAEKQVAAVTTGSGAAANKKKAAVTKPKDIPKPETTAAASAEDRAAAVASPEKEEAEESKAKEDEVVEVKAVASSSETPEILPPTADDTDSEQPGEKVLSEEAPLEETPTEAMASEEAPPPEEALTEEKPTEVAPIDYPAIDDPSIGDPSIGIPSFEDPSIIGDPSFEDPSIDEPSIGDPSIGYPSIEEMPTEDTLTEDIKPDVQPEEEVTTTVPETAPETENPTTTDDDDDDDKPSESAVEETTSTAKPKKALTVITAHAPVSSAKDSTEDQDCTPSAVFMEKVDDHPSSEDVNVSVLSRENVEKLLANSGEVGLDEYGDPPLEEMESEVTVGGGGPFDDANLQKCLPSPTESILDSFVPSPIHNLPVTPSESLLDNYVPSPVNEAQAESSAFSDDIFSDDVFSEPVFAEHTDEKKDDERTKRDQVIDEEKKEAEVEDGTAKDTITSWDLSNSQFSNLVASVNKSSDDDMDMLFDTALWETKDPVDKNGSPDEDKKAAVANENEASGSSTENQTTTKKASTEGEADTIDTFDMFDTSSWAAGTDTGFSGFSTTSLSKLGMDINSERNFVEMMKEEMKHRTLTEEERGMLFDAQAAINKAEELENAERTAAAKDDEPLMGGEVKASNSVEVTSANCGVALKDRLKSYATTEPDEESVDESSGTKSDPESQDDDVEATVEYVDQQNEFEETDQMESSDSEKASPQIDDGHVSATNVPTLDVAAAAAIASNSKELDAQDDNFAIPMTLEELRNAPPPPPPPPPGVPKKKKKVKRKKTNSTSSSSSDAKNVPLISPPPEEKMKKWEDEQQRAMKHVAALKEKLETTKDSYAASSDYFHFQPVGGSKDNSFDSANCTEKKQDAEQAGVASSEPQLDGVASHEDTPTRIDSKIVEDEEPCVDVGIEITKLSTEESDSFPLNEFVDAPAVDFVTSTDTVKDKEQTSSRDGEFPDVHTDSVNTTVENNNEAVVTDQEEETDPSEVNESEMPTSAVSEIPKAASVADVESEAPLPTSPASEDRNMPSKNVQKNDTRKENDLVSSISERPNKEQNDFVSPVSSTSEVPKELESLSDIAQEVIRQNEETVSMLYSPKNNLWRQEVADAMGLVERLEEEYDKDIGIDSYLSPLLSDDTIAKKLSQEQERAMARTKTATTPKIPSGQYTIPESTSDSKPGTDSYLSPLLSEEKVAKIPTEPHTVPESTSDSQPSEDSKSLAGTDIDEQDVEYQSRGRPTMSLPDSECSNDVMNLTKVLTVEMSETPEPPAKQENLTSIFKTPKGDQRSNKAEKFAEKKSKPLLIDSRMADKIAMASSAAANTFEKRFTPRKEQKSVTKGVPKDPQLEAISWFSTEVLHLKSVDLQKETDFSEVARSLLEKKEHFNLMCRFVADRINEVSVELKPSLKFSDSSLNSFDTENPFSSKSTMSSTSSGDSAENSVEAQRVLLKPVILTDATMKVSNKYLAANFVSFLYMASKLTKVPSPFGDKNPFLAMIVASTINNTDDKVPIQTTQQLLFDELDGKAENLIDFVYKVKTSCEADLTVFAAAAIVVDKTFESSIGENISDTDLGRRFIFPEGHPSPFENSVSKVPRILGAVLSFIGDPVAVCRMKMVNTSCRRIIDENEHALMQDAVRSGGIDPSLRPAFWMWITLEKCGVSDRQNEFVGSEELNELEKQAEEGKWHHVIQRDVARSFGNMPPHKTGAKFRSDSIVTALVTWGQNRIMKRGVKGGGEPSPIPEIGEQNNRKQKAKRKSTNISSPPWESNEKKDEDESVQSKASDAPTDTVSDWSAVSPKGSFVGSVNESEAPAVEECTEEIALSGNSLSPDVKADLQSKLSYILHSLAATYEDIGYCQGMDYVVAHLLRNLQDTIRLKAAHKSLPAIISTASSVNVDDPAAFENIGTITNEIDSHRVVEESIVRIMDTFFVSYNLKHMYWPELRCLKTCCRVFERLIQIKLPVLADHFEHHDLNVGLFALGWFQTLFLYLPSMPAATVCHMWDIWLVERSFKIFFRVGTAILFLSQPILLNNELDGMMTYLNTIPDATLLRPDILIPCALNIKVTNRMLQDLEDEVMQNPC